MLVRLPHSLALALALTGGMLIAPAQAAPVPKGGTDSSAKARTASKSEKIRTVLDSVVKLEYSQVALPAVLAQLSDDYKVNFILDRAILMQMGVDDNSLMVESKQKDVKLRSGLRNLVGQFGLTYVVAGDSIVVTTEEAGLVKQFKQRVTINHVDAPLSKALKELSSETGINIVFDPKVIKAKGTENPITVQLEDVCFDAAVRLLCEMGGLKAARMSNIVYVTTEERADKINKDGDLVPANPNGFPGGGIVVPGVPGIGIAPGGIGGIEAKPAIPPQVDPEVPAVPGGAAPAIQIERKVAPAQPEKPDSTNSSAPARGPAR